MSLKLWSRWSGIRQFAWRSGAWLVAGCALLVGPTLAQTSSSPGHSSNSSSQSDSDRARQQGTANSSQTQPSSSNRSSTSTTSEDDDPELNAPETSTTQSQSPNSPRSTSGASSTSRTSQNEDDVRFDRSSSSAPANLDDQYRTPGSNTSSQPRTSSTSSYDQDQRSTNTHDQGQFSSRQGSTAPGQQPSSTSGNYGQNQQYSGQSQQPSDSSNRPDARPYESQTRQQGDPQFRDQQFQSSQGRDYQTQQYNQQAREQQFQSRQPGDEQARDQQNQNRQFTDQQARDQQLRNQQSQQFNQRDQFSQQQSQQNQSNFNSNTQANVNANLGINWSNSSDSLSVSNIQPGTVAANIGLRQGDQIVSINNTQVSSPSEFQRIISTVQPGTQLPIVVWRNGQRETLYWTVAHNTFSGPMNQQFWGINWGGAGGQMAIASLAPNSLATQIGFRPGDQIVAVNHVRISSPSDFQRVIATVQPGVQLPIVVYRNGVQQTLYWSPNNSYGVSQQQAYQQNSYAEQSYASPAGGEAFLGVTLDPSYSGGALVTQVAPGSPAERAGIRQGDMIVRLNHQQVHSANDLTAAIGRMSAGSTIDLAVSRRQVSDVQVQLGSSAGMQLSQPGYGQQPQFEEARRDANYYRGDNTNDGRGLLPGRDFDNDGRREGLFRRDR